MLCCIVTTSITYLCYVPVGVRVIWTVFVMLENDVEYLKAIMAVM